MTYDLHIGKRLSELDTNEAGEPIISVYVAQTEHDKAPAYPGALVSRHTNRVCVPYDGSASGFEGALKVAPILHDALFPKRLNDDIVIITPELVSAAHQAVVAYRKRHKGAQPSFELTDHCATLARLMVLRWWLHYALHTYSDPIVRISA